MRVRHSLFALCLLSLACSSDATAPIPADKFATVSSGFLFSCGLLGDGSAVCWGDNAVGQLGNGEVSTIDSTPNWVHGLLVFTQITTGDAQA